MLGARFGQLRGREDGGIWESNALLYLGRVLANRDMLQLDNVSVFAVLQDLYLPQARHGQAIPVVCINLQPLERDDLARCDLLRPRDPAVCALLNIIELVVVFYTSALAPMAAFET
jgi:hypothetical protein